jgi:hypothetical protein
VSTLMDVYHQLCTEDRIPETRRKNFRTTLRYLAESYDSTPDRLALTPEVESTYRDHLRDYLTAQGKHLTKQGKPSSAIRNAIQEVGQFLKAYHELTRTPAVPLAPLPHERRVRYDALLQHMGEASPYKHQTSLIASRYRLTREHWPVEIATGFARFRRVKQGRIRDATMESYVHNLETYLGYLAMTGESRLDHLPPESRRKLALKRYQDDLQTITAPPVLSSWDDLFILDHLKGFITWHAWRIHTPADAQVHERPPSTPSTSGHYVAATVQHIATTLKRTKDAKRLKAYLYDLPYPKKLHNKGAAYHTFSFAELEQVALTLINEARHMTIYLSNHDGPVRYPGCNAALRFQLGLVLMMGWRTPMRARNWCEMLRETNLRKVNGTWWLHFEGTELKVATRRSEPNKYEVEIEPEVVPYLEEFLDRWRPLMPGAAQDRHVFLSRHGGGGMMPPRLLYNQLKIHVFRLTHKRLYMHLLRTIFVSNHLARGVPVNAVAYALNDHPISVQNFYNELQGVQHQQSLREANRQALLHGHGNGTSS